MPRLGPFMLVKYIYKSGSSNFFFLFFGWLAGSLAGWLAYWDSRSDKEHFYFFVLKKHYLVYEIPTFND